MWDWWTSSCYIPLRYWNHSTGSYPAALDTFRVWIEPARGLDCLYCLYRMSSVSRSLCLYRIERLVDGDICYNHTRSIAR